MVNINSSDDIASLKKITDILVTVINNPDLYQILNYESEAGTSHTEVEDEDVAVQRIGISVVYQKKS